MARARRGGSPPEDDRPPPRRGLRTGNQPSKRLESKAETFVRLVNGRMPFVDEAVANLRKLSNRETYEYTPRQVDAIVAHLQGLVDSVEEAFRTGRQASTFRLDLDPEGRDDVR